MSIKRQERLKRGQGKGLQFKNLAAGHKVKQFDHFLKEGSNKNNLIKFVADHWCEEQCRKRLNNKILYVNQGRRCLKVTTNSIEEIDELSSDQE